jgi:hypothetical protein
MSRIAIAAQAMIERSKVLKCHSLAGSPAVRVVFVAAGGYCSSNLLVSHNEGRLFRISPDGRVATILDTTALRMNIADFAYGRQEYGGFPDIHRQ